MILKEESLSSEWNYICCFEKVMRNKITEAEFYLSGGKYISSLSGIIRIGEKATSIDSTFELIERTVVVFGPDLSRMTLEDKPLSSYLYVFFSNIQFLPGNTSMDVVLRPWAEQNYANWTSSSGPNYGSVMDNYIPFDLASVTYDSSIYETELELFQETTGLYFLEITDLISSYVNGNSIGLAISGTGGYIDIYSPDYSYTDQRPLMLVTQNISYALANYMVMDVEIIGRSRVVGVCRDLYGNPVIGSLSYISVLDTSTHQIVGSGTSNPVNGFFEISLTCKFGTAVLVLMTNESVEINGSEIMYSLVTA